LEIPAAEVRVLLHRARTRLRALLDCGVLTKGEGNE
jgi:DNA-directed RNA polymerase specialized sigma24 family protein